MAKTTLKDGKQPVVSRKPSHEGKDGSLQGTFASVMIVGGFIIVTWSLVYFLFLSR